MMKKNEKKLLKDQFSKLYSCGCCGCCWRGAFGVKKVGISPRLNMENLLEVNDYEESTRKRVMTVR